MSIRTAFDICSSILCFLCEMECFHYVNINNEGYLEFVCSRCGYTQISTIEEN